MLDALWLLLQKSSVPLEKVLIFLPSRRAVRSVEKMLVQKSGHSVLLPELVALGEGLEDEEKYNDESLPDVISNMERTVILAKLLSADSGIGSLSAALPVARDLVRMHNYLENEGVNIADIDWMGLVDEKYADHFQHKAKLLNILSSVLPNCANGRITETQKQNKDIRSWIDFLKSDKCDKDLIVVCGSTASVPATADLMEYISGSDKGKIILSGKISGREQDFILNTNPYNAEYKFLQRLGINQKDVLPIDVGNSAIDFFNSAFGNDTTDIPEYSLDNCKLIECARESEEALTVAVIAEEAIKQNKSVLVITPDAAANQRIANVLSARNISADFSAGRPGNMTYAGRAVLNIFDYWIDNEKSEDFYKLYAQENYDLFKTISVLVDSKQDLLEPLFDLQDAESLQIWQAIKKLSDSLNAAEVKLSLSDARAFIADVISTVSIREEMKDDVDVVVLGTIESRMQTADVIILTGLNDGMFPAVGYENAWLPRSIGEKIGLPSPDRKVSLMSLDFMNLSCGKEVYWLRSKVSGGVQTIESRFISRVMVKHGNICLDQSFLGKARDFDNVISIPLDYSAPNPPVDWSDVYVTELEKLINNPYAFYVSHILRLKVLDDYWVIPDARKFGNLVHESIQKVKNRTPENLIADMDRRALEILGKDSVLFYFWHKRFVEMAPLISNVINQIPEGLFEIQGQVNIKKRNVKARADFVWSGGVIDFKTGAAPKKSQLQDGTMPQLPLEAYILKQGGFPVKPKNPAYTPIMMFLQLKNKNVKPIVYEDTEAENMINAAVLETEKLFDWYSSGKLPYVYKETNDAKYKNYDDLARRFD